MMDRDTAKVQLKKDILNSVHHIFGHHEQCSQDFCKVEQGEQLQMCNAESTDQDKDSTDNDHLD